MGELSSAVLGRSTPSLSKTCEAWLGKPLDKTECASKWDVRCEFRDGATVSLCVCVKYEVG